MYLKSFVLNLPLAANMKIVVDCKPFQHSVSDDETARFTIRVLHFLWTRYPDWHWSFVVDKNATKLLNWVPENQRVVSRSLPGMPGWRIWFDRRILSIIRKLDASLLIETGAIAVNTSIPQLTLVPDAPGISVFTKKYARLVEKRMTNTIKSSSLLVTNSAERLQFFREQGLTDYPSAFLFEGEPDEKYRQLSWTDRESVKIKYSGGVEYFVLAADSWSTENLLPVLKAFGQFKSDNSRI